MKKSLYLTAAAALALTSCSQDDLLNGIFGSNDNAIAFDSYLGKSAQTRATVVDKESLKTEGFGVNAYYYNSAESKTEVFMKNTKVTFNGEVEKGSWVYSPVKYWPNNDDDDLSFYAYGPYNNKNITVNETDFTELGFTVNNKVLDQVDFIYNDQVENPTLNLIKPTVNEKVSFKFQHALSRIGFTVQVVVDETDKEKSYKLDGNTHINVKEVEIIGNNDASFYESGTLDMSATGTWKDVTGSQNFTFTGDNFYRTVKVEGEEVVQLHKFNQKQSLLNEKSYLMIIPQDFTTDGFNIKITYDVITEGENGDNSTITNEITSETPLQVNFEQGKAYNFNLILGMTSVKFDVDEVVAWEDATTPDTWLPGNNEDIEDDGNASTLALAGDVNSVEVPFSGGLQTVTMTSASSNALTISYSADGRTWYSDAADAGMNWFTVSADETDAEIATFDSEAVNSFVYNINIPQATAETTTGSYKDALAANEVKGSESAPWDLSMHDIFGTPTKQNTANCYVINSSGTYMLPLQYGNMLTDGDKNGNAICSGASGMYPAISDDYQTPGASTAKELWSDKKGLIKNIDVTSRYGYIIFDVDKDLLDECNAVIAAVNEAGTITWSWHIWITPVNLSAVTSNSFNDAVMPVYLGWCSNGSSTDVKISKYSAESGYVKFTQSGKAGEQSVQIPVKRGGYVCTGADTKAGYRNTYYQWGRKDPLYAVDGTTFTTGTDGGFHETIVNPTVFYTSTSESPLYVGSWNSRLSSYADSWDKGSKSTANSSTTANSITQKTIFDPCPPGFAVAPANTFKDSSVGDTQIIAGTDGKIYMHSPLHLKSADGTTITQEECGYSYCWSSGFKGSYWVYGMKYGEGDSESGAKSISLYEYMDLGNGYPVRAVADK